VKCAVTKASKLQEKRLDPQALRKIDPIPTWIKKLWQLNALAIHATAILSWQLNPAKTTFHPVRVGSNTTNVVLLLILIQ
jgi:hypothetical protein